MENHPIPQDVTGFQFRLIGSLTVKQFAYIATGGILAVIFYNLPFPFLLKIPFILIPAGVGLALAFIPIEGRPMDTMIIHFLKDLTEPNQYLYQKMGGKLPISVINIHHAPALMSHSTKEKGSPAQKKERSHQKEKKLKAFLGSLHAQVRTKLDEKEGNYLASLFASPSLGVPGGPTIISIEPVHKEKQHEEAPPQVLPKSLPLSPQEKEEALVKEALMLKTELDQARLQETQQKTPEDTKAAHESVLSIEQQLQATLSQKERLEQELIALRKQLSTKTQNTVAPAAGQVIQQSRLVHTVPKTMAKTIGFPHVPDVPNLLVGIIKDSRGNVLPNILVEVKDKDGNPVRAFKTNLLGHFGSATQLTNGVYIIEFEDPKKQHQFDVIELQVTGQIILPLEIISQDAREQLRKELFN